MFLRKTSGERNRRRRLSAVVSLLLVLSILLPDIMAVPTYASGTDAAELVERTLPVEIYFDENYETVLTGSGLYIPDAPAAETAEAAQPATEPVQEFPEEPALSVEEAEETEPAGSDETTEVVENETEGETESETEVTETEPEVIETAPETRIENPAPVYEYIEEPERWITVEGLLPGNVTAKAYPVTVETAGDPVITGYNIRLLNEDGSDYFSGNQLTVTMHDPAIVQAIEAGKAMTPWRMANEEAAAEKLESFLVDQENVRVKIVTVGLAFIFLTVESEEVPAEVTDSYEFDSAYTLLRISGATEEGAEPAVTDVKETLGAPDGYTVLDAYLIEGADSFESVELTIKSVPEVNASQSLALYLLNAEGKLPSEPLQTAPAAGEVLPLGGKRVSGYALVMIDNHNDETTMTVSADESTVELTGLMPANGSVTVETVDESYGENTLTALDITITDALGEEFQPAASEPITVQISNPAIEEAIDEGLEIRVQHVLDDGTLQEVAVTELESGAIAFSATGFSTYVVSATESVGDILWANDQIYITGKVPSKGIIDVTPVTVTIPGEHSVAAYDIKIYTNENQKKKGHVWQPSKDQVQVHFYDAAFGNETLNVYHMEDEYEKAEYVATVTAENGWLTFEAPSFSIYVVSTIEKEIEASDGRTYKITVEYSDDAGIPEGAALEVTEVPENAYADYMNSAAEALGQDIHHVAFGKFFDISIVKNGVEYQPNGKVTVRVELLDAASVSDVKVVHFGDESDALPVEATTYGSTVSFETSGFSVFSFLDFSVIDRVIGALLGETTGTLYENDDIILTGRMPANGIVEAERVDKTIGEQESLVAYDIKIYANSLMKLLGIVWQPSDGAIQVTMKSDALTVENVDVYHMKNDVPLFVTTTAVANGSVTFDADSFSDYVIVDHEGGEVITPRFTIHYLSPVTDLATQESEVNGEYFYTVSPYAFLNKAGTTQSTQIVQNGETLEMITNPPNQPNKYFYGWYVVSVSSSSGNTHTFQWTPSPKHLPSERPIAVSDNGDGTFTMRWTVDGNSYSETAAVDPNDYSAHIYVAPIYEDYCFVNFHELAYAVSNVSNLLTRKLVILGDDLTESVLISDVSAPVTDAIRRIFRGWQYRANNTWISVQTMDNNGNPITKTINVTGDVDLYPFFQEGRWLYFNTGDSGNGAQYVPAQFTMAEFDAEGGEASVGGQVTSLPTTRRVGYDFGGWRVITDNSDPDNPVFMTVTDGNGNFLNGINLSINETYQDNDGNDQVGVAYTIQNGTLTIKYPLSSLTFYALWTEKLNTQYTVVVWKQRVNDSKNAVESARTYDYYALSTSVAPTVVNSSSGLELSDLNLTVYESLATNATTRGDFVGFHLRDTNPAVMSDARVRGDGSTVVNIYYDRDLMTINFNANGRTIPGATTQYTYTATTSNNGTQYGLVNGEYVELTRQGYYNNYYWTYGSADTRYNGTRYTRSSSSGLQWTGLYGQTFVQNGYSWDTVSGFRWNEQAGGGGTTQTFLTGFTQTDNPYNLYCQGNVGNNYIYHLRQALDGSYSNDPADELIESAQMNNTSGTFNFSNKYNGFTVASYSTTFMAGGGNNAVSPGSQASVTYPIYVYHTRNSYTLTFDYNYPIQADMGANQYLQKSPPGEIKYGASLSSYNYYTNPSDTTNAIRPSESEIPDHYEFDGWYEDAAGTTRFDFNGTMPDGDKIIYGKWNAIYYTVSIDPNGGVIDHINYTEPTDGGWPTFYLEGFTSANAADPKWIAAWNANGDTVGTMPAWATTLAAVGTGHNTSQSTYFNALYGTPIGEYELQRTYVEYRGTEADAAAANKTVYYYVNMQFNSTSGEWGLHADMRNALYLTPAQLEPYYKYLKAAQAWHEASRPGYYDGTLPATFEDFKELYVRQRDDHSYTLYEEVPNGSYAFIGWYVVNGDGSLSDTPYSFANAVEDDLVLRAVWRRVGSYYIAYDPCYLLTLPDSSTVVINGQITAWTDPSTANDEKYNDGAVTNTLQQPTGITVNGVDAGTEYIFRGWQVADFLGYDANGFAIYSPKHDVYYAEPTPFVIDADDADNNGCIHMRAVYQTVNDSDRRPAVANLMLHANDGYLTNAAGVALTADSDISSAAGWTGNVGKVVEDFSEQEIVYGDIQSNVAVHLYKIAVANGTLDSPYNASYVYYKHPENYLLVGFDEGSDYSLDRTATTSDDIKTGDAYIPTYAADSVISVQRTDSVKLYAVWEPMVYVTFVNRTDQPVTYHITGSGNAMSIVNEVTSAFGREKFTETEITLAAGERIKLVMPRGAGQTFTITGTNTNTAQLLTVTSFFDNVQTSQATAGPYRPSAAGFELTDTLREDEVGVFVYFDGVDTVFYDVNGGTWTDTRTGSDRATVLNSNGSLLFVDEDGLPYAPVNLPATAPEPTDPTRTNQTFVGWTASLEAAQCVPTEYTLPGTDSANGINNLAVIQESMLWDFSDTADSGMTLYAVWSATVTVTFHIRNTHTWTETDSAYYVPGANRTYVVTLPAGSLVEQPDRPTWDSENQFYRWVTVSNYQDDAEEVANITNIYDFSNPVLTDLDLYTSWVEASSFIVRITKNVSSGLTADLTKPFTFTATITTTTYSRASISNNTQNNVTTNSRTTTEEQQTFTLRDGESVDITLHYKATDSVYRPNNSTLSVFFQSVRIDETSDADFTVSVVVNGGSPTTYGLVDSMQNSPASYTITRTGTNYYRTFTLNATSSLNTTVTNKNSTANPNTVEFTNTRTSTDVTVTKQVVPDDYVDGNEAFSFTAQFKNSVGTVITPPTPPASAGYSVDSSTRTVSFTLTDGGSVLLRGIPIGGSVTVTESTPGWSATSENDADPTDRSGQSFTLSGLTETGGGITFTNERITYDVTVTNNVLPEEYGSKTKNFTYTATLWHDDEQAVFPSSITDVTFTNGRKNMTFTLKDDEDYVIEDLPGGYKLVVTQVAEEDYTTATRSGSDPFTEGLSYTLSNLGADAEIDFQNTLDTGEYTITKNVQLGLGQSLPPGTVFSFTARLLATADALSYEPISAALNTLVTAAGATVNGSSIKFTLADGEDITLPGLPVGYFLQVQEAAPGYAAYVNTIRTDSVTRQIDEGDNGDINYINRPASTVLQIQKTDEDDGNPVQGAVFRLYNLVNTIQNTLFTLTSDANGVLKYTEADVTSSLMSLENGTYYLAEQTAPAGYRKISETITIVVDNRLDAEHRITITGSGAATLSGPDADSVYTMTVTNKKAVLAPTGFISDISPFILILIVGAALVLLALASKRKRDSEEDDSSESPSPVSGLPPNDGIRDPGPPPRAGPILWILFSGKWPPGSRRNTAQNEPAALARGEPRSRGDPKPRGDPRAGCKNVCLRQKGGARDAP